MEKTLGFFRIGNDMKMIELPMAVDGWKAEGLVLKTPASYERYVPVQIEEGFKNKLESSEKGLIASINDILVAETEIFRLWEVAHKRYIRWMSYANSGGSKPYMHCWGTSNLLYQSYNNITLKIFADVVNFEDNLFKIIHRHSTDLVHIVILDGSFLEHFFDMKIHTRVGCNWKKVVSYEELNATAILDEYEAILKTPVKRVDDPIHPTERGMKEDEYRPLARGFEMLRKNFWDFEGNASILFDLNRASEQILVIKIKAEGYKSYKREVAFANMNRRTADEIYQQFLAYKK